MGVYSAGVYSLGAYNYRQPISDLEMMIPWSLHCGSLQCGSLRLGSLHFSGYRFWIWKCSCLGIYIVRVYSAGVYGLGVYNSRATDLGFGNAHTRGSKVWESTMLEFTMNFAVVDVGLEMMILGIL